MKLPPSLLMLPVALGVGFLVGKQRDLAPEKAALTESQNARESRTGDRSSRTDPFGGQSFSLTSMEEVHALFKRHGSSVASAKLTLAVNSLSAAEIPALVEMVQQEFRDNPDRYDSDSYVLMAALFERWAMVDPAASIAFVNSCKSRSFQKFAAASCFGALGKIDPDRALLEFEKLPQGEIRETAGVQLVSALADVDPAAACDLLQKESSPGVFGDYYISEVFREMGEDRSGGRRRAVSSDAEGTSGRPQRQYVSGKLGAKGSRGGTQMGKELEG